MAFKKKVVIPRAERGVEDIKQALQSIKAKFGDEAIMMLGERPKVNVDAIPSGSIGLDYALGIGGYPRGRILEVYGPESSGKTTLSLHAIAEAQKRGGICAFIDAEHRALLRPGSFLKVSHAEPAIANPAAR